VIREQSRIMGRKEKGDAKEVFGGRENYSELPGRGGSLEYVCHYLAAVCCGKNSRNLF